MKLLLLQGHHVHPDGTSASDEDNSQTVRGIDAKDLSHHSNMHGANNKV